MSKNPLENYFYRKKHELIHKWVHYFDIYHRHLSPYKNKRVKILEFGVSHGGSLRMWKNYFGRKAQIIGVDINPECKKLESGNVKIFIGNQEDRVFLKKLMSEIGNIDVVIEDGGHTMKQQIHTFEEVYPYVNNGGVFLIEDLHTSYWKAYGGGYKKANTFVEYAKNLVDELNAWHSEVSDLQVNKNTRSIRGIHIYDSVIVFDKDKVPKPHHKMTGYRTLKH